MEIEGEQHQDEWHQSGTALSIRKLFVLIETVARRHNYHGAKDLLSKVMIARVETETETVWPCRQRRMKYNSGFIIYGTMRRDAKRGSESEFESLIPPEPKTR